MSIGLGTMARLARGKLGMEEITELLASNGLNVEFKEIPKEDAEGAFQGAAQLAMLAGAKLTVVEGQTEQGDKFGALIIICANSG